MRISFERTGGFAGITMKTTIDERDLAPDEAQKLRRMVEEADFFNLSRKIMSWSPHPDRFQYEFRVEENGRQHMVIVSEEAMPEKLKPLVQWLMEKARQAREGTGSL